MDHGRHIAKLVLEDGSTFPGYTFGYKGSVAGEVVFNTGMIGYPESLTDPSYHGQILALTYPLIGNYGVPGEKKGDNLFTCFESDRIHVEGLIVADYSADYSHWSAEKSLSEWMKQHHITGVSGVDTRALTKKLREKGTMLGKILCDDKDDVFLQDPNKRSLVSEVSLIEPLVYEKGST